MTDTENKFQSLGPMIGKIGIVNILWLIHYLVWWCCPFGLGDKLCLVSWKKEQYKRLRQQVSWSGQLIVGHLFTKTEI